jgi:NAD(P)-dependent dehydrogenase (short-subunit alcohol dehydrogenase family)
VTCDLSSQEAIRRLSSNIASQVDVVDVLVNNAGAIYSRREISCDGLEMTFALNHIAYFLLTLLLLPLLRKSPASRIVVVASHAHENARIHFEDLQFEKGYDRLAAYGQSKLANMLFASELARRLTGEQITVNALTPGAVATNLGKNNSRLKVLARNFVNLRMGSMVTPETGAKTVVYLAASPEVEGITGGYFRDEKPASVSAGAKDTDAARRLWEVSEMLTGCSIFAGVRDSR